MDKFSDAEAGVLENHGYTLAEVAVRKHIPQLYKEIPMVPPSPSLWPELEKRIEVEATIRNLLADSSQIHILGH
jgi:hypothetical protein